MPFLYRNLSLSEIARQDFNPGQNKYSGTGPDPDLAETASLILSLYFFRKVYAEEIAVF